MYCVNLIGYMPVIILNKYYVIILYVSMVALSIVTTNGVSRLDFLNDFKNRLHLMINEIIRYINDSFYLSKCLYGY